MSETVIKFDNVSKSYNIHERGYRFFRNELTNYFRRALSAMPVPWSAKPDVRPGITTRLRAG